MFLIVSGCDRSGKTTLIQKIQERLHLFFPDKDIQYKHFSQPKAKEDSDLSLAQIAYDEYTSFIMSAHYDYPDTIFLIDRFYECENIYAPLYRNYDSPYRYNLDKLLTQYLTIPVLFVYVKADKEVILQRIQECGEDYVNLEDIPKVINLYNDYIKTIRVPYIIINNNKNEDLESNVDLCINSLERMYIMKQTDKYHYYNFGNLQANKMIVTDNVDNISSINEQLVINQDYDYNSYWITTYKDFKSDLKMLHNINDVIFVQDKG